MVSTFEADCHMTERPDAPEPSGMQARIEAMVHEIAQRAFQLHAMEGSIVCSSIPPDDSSLHIYRGTGTDLSTVLLDAHRICHYHGDPADARTRHMAQMLQVRIVHSPETNDVAEQWQYYQKPNVLSDTCVESLKQEFLTFVTAKLTAIDSQSHTFD